MFEITKSMMDNAVETERQNKLASDRALSKTAIAIFVVLAIQAFLLVAIISTDIPRGLLLAAVTVLIDSALFALIVIIASKKYMRGFELYDLFHAFLNYKFNRTVMKADVKTQIKLYGEKLARAKSSAGKVRYMSVISDLYLNDGRFDDAEKMLDEAKRIPVKNNTAKIMRLNSLLDYYNAKEDKESYIRVFDDNTDILRLWWNKNLILQFELYGKYMTYVNMKDEYSKALELYDHYFAAHEKAAEFDASYAISDDMKEVSDIDYAKLYFKLGNREKALEHFRTAEEKFADTDNPLIKKAMEDMRKMFEQADAG